MSFTTFTMKITAFLTLVTSIKCATSSEPALKSRGSIDAMSVKNQPANIVRSENKNFLQVKEYNGVDKFMTNFEDKTIRKKVYYDTDHYHFNDTFQPQNVFKCPPCICRNISSNLVSVYCKDCIFTSIPQNWSFEIEEIIIISCDRFKVLDLRTLLIYTFLTRVQIITRSLIEILSSSSLNVSTSVTELDLTYNSISKVEDKSFLLLPNLLKLSLPRNKLKGLTKQTFTGLNSLLYLSVSRNEINFIAHDTFDDLGNLLTLDISHNKIIYTWNDLLPSGIFNPLRNLEELYINDVCRHGTYQCGTYPNRALQVLKNLRLLKIDEADTRGLGPEIKSLLHLRHLIIDLPVSENFTDESFFDNVPSITTLEFSSTETKISPKAFTKLTKLVGLTNPIRFGRSNICEVLSDMKYFVNSSLKYLTLRNVNTYKSGCRKLKAQDARYLTLFKLIELDLSENDLHDLSPDFIKMLPATLQKFDLSYNGFYYKIIYSFSLFPKDLVDLNLNNQKIEYCECHDVGDITPRNGEGNNLSASNSLRYTRTESENYFQQLSLNMSKNGFLPKLHILRADNFRKFGWTLQLIFDFLLDYQVKELSLAGGEFKNWDLFYLTPEIKVADFSSNYAESFNIDFFPENSLLEYLSISNNFLGPAFQNDSESLFFVNTKKLIELEMSRNFITELAGDYFRNLDNLQILDISQNKLQMINISFSHMTELRFLDFSSNSITSISKQSRDELDIIASDHRMYMDLTSNPLPCTCEGLELMKWMAFTNVYLLSQDFLVCRNEFNQVLEIGNIVQRVETLQRQCASKTVIILTCVFSIIVFGILLLTSLMYRYRWKLRYLRSIALVKLLGSRPGAMANIGYRFDAYFLYTDDTRRFVVHDCVRELEEKRGHRLCIEERDFLPGTYIVSNIVSGVQNSAKTVAMVTPEFYQGEYSEYSIKMALMEEIFMRRSVLFLCVCEPTDDKDLSHDLLTAMKQNNYIEYPPRDDVTDEIIEEFWNQFSRAVGRNDREEI